MRLVEFVECVESAVTDMPLHQSSTPTSSSIRFCKHFVVDLDDPLGGDLHAPTQLAMDGSMNSARE
jgi:hypothetical protein